MLGLCVRRAETVLLLSISSHPNYIKSLLKAIFWFHMCFDIYFLYWLLIKNIMSVCKKITKKIEANW